MVATAKYGSFMYAEVDRYIIIWNVILQIDDTLWTKKPSKLNFPAVLWTILSWQNICEHAPAAVSREDLWYMRRILNYYSR